MGCGDYPSRVAALLQAMIPEFWFLTAASRIHQPIVHQVGLGLAQPYSQPPFCRVLAHGGREHGQCLDRLPHSCVTQLPVLREGPASQLIAIEANRRPHGEMWDFGTGTRDRSRW